MADESRQRVMRLAFIGSAGIPNRYGGFESFLEHCGPAFARLVDSIVVTCDARLYCDDASQDFHGVRRVFLKVPANGAASVLHDLLAFFAVYRGATHIVVLGVSGGPWFPLFRLMCLLGGKRLCVNIDGVEWRRTKFGRGKQRLLRLFDALAQRFSHIVIYDNAALASYVLPASWRNAVQIGYSGDQVLRLPGVKSEPGTALTICRIEPENNLDLLIEGALASPLSHYTIIGNWDNSEYGRALRKRHASNDRLSLLDPIYEARRLAERREACTVYLHGHSVGGTNPSLVEMLYYDCAILCFDVDYNRATAVTGVGYFADAQSLAREIGVAMGGSGGGDRSSRAALRERYTREAIAEAYVDALRE